MIDHARLATLRDRFAALRGDYARSGEEVRTFALQLGRERAALVVAVSAGIVRDRQRRNPHLAAITPEKVAHDPDTAALVEGMADAELEAAGVKPAQINNLRAREIVLARKRKAHEHLGARVRVWSSYMEGIERLAAEYSA